MKSEFELIKEIVKKIPKNHQGLIGIGDDCGVRLVPRGTNLLVTTDTLVEGVDFEMRQVSADKVGRKALAVNLSDIAAMGAKPFAFVVALGIPKGMPQSWIKKFYSGMNPLIQKYELDCLGGDISSAKEFFVAITMIGIAEKKRFVRRVGARSGEAIFVTGELGGSILRKQFLFQPRINEAQFLVQKFKPSAMIDISDGFLQDLGHVLESSGVGARLSGSEIPVSGDAVTLSRRSKKTAFQHALSDGEDFELVFTLQAHKIQTLRQIWKKKFPKTRLSEVGKVINGKNQIHWLKKEDAIEASKITQKGYTHF